MIVRDKMRKIKREREDCENRNRINREKVRRIERETIPKRKRERESVEENHQTQRM